ncbi:hypothetical protein OPV22_027661 [Ensete ventricosum]|uniref:Uncharacterized protein n=1 Tax=Ensete ventricosum TaxID=4639 RepID=A0AAV8Q189_ENSVE|nr:hypothetical protein OPV22_027661 [Ensete ventricosum]
MQTGGISASLRSSLIGNFWDYLDVPIICLSSQVVLTPYARTLNEWTMRSVAMAIFSSSKRVIARYLWFHSLFWLRNYLVRPWLTVLQTQKQPGNTEDTDGAKSLMIKDQSFMREGIIWKLMFVKVVLRSTRREACRQSCYQWQKLRQDQLPSWPANDSFGCHHRILLAFFTAPKILWNPPVDVVAT